MPTVSRSDARLPRGGRWAADGPARQGADVRPGVGGRHRGDGGAANDGAAPARLVQSAPLAPLGGAGLSQRASERRICSFVARLSRLGAAALAPAAGGDRDATYGGTAW